MSATALINLLRALRGNMVGSPEHRDDEFRSRDPE